MSWYLGLYWGPSSEPASVEVSANQVWDSLAMLRDELGCASSWSSGDVILDGADSLATALATGVHTKDTTGEVIPTLGQTIGIQSLDQHDLVVNVSVGGSADTWTGVFVCQTRLLANLDRSRAGRLLGRLVEIWCPAHAALTTSQLRRAGWQAGLSKKGPAAGWLTWVSPDLHDPLPGPVEELGGGRLHVLAPTADEATVDRVLHVLEGTGPTSTP
ncbi:hypothetical protein BJF80_03280 [Serinicoccus sp. CUA-874]|nr:hypothetical protein BJF80_03280 [Serinicoccus sp. CUA-874]